jgi:hypothetical protein
MTVNNIHKQNIKVTGLGSNDLKKDINYYLNNMYSVILCFIIICAKLYVACFLQLKLKLVK